MKPKIYIAANIHAQKYIDSILVHIEERNIARPIGIHYDFANPNDYTIDRFERTLSPEDYGVIILTTEDLTLDPHENQYIIKDYNLIFQLGLLVGKLSRKKCFIITPAKKKVKLPTDIVGVTPITYNPSRNIDEALETPSIKISNRVKEDVEGFNLTNKIFPNLKIRIGCVSYKPFSDYIGDDDIAQCPTGLYVDIMKEIIESNELVAEWKALKWDNLITAINEDYVDCILSVFATPKRLKYAQFSFQKHIISLSAVVLNNSKINCYQDLLKEDGIKIAFVEGEIGSEYVNKMRKSDFRTFEFVPVKSKNISDVFKLVKNKSVDIAIADSLSCYMFIEEGKHEVTEKCKLVQLENCRWIGSLGIMHKNQKDIKDWLDLWFTYFYEYYRDIEKDILTKYDSIVKIK